jgi:hypothetical protein
MSDRAGRKPHTSFGFLDFVWRWIAALLLVFATWNPSGYSWFDWVRAAFSGEGLRAQHYFVGVILVAGWAIFLIATERSLGALGSVIGAAVIGTGIWLLVDLGLLRAESLQTIAWLALIALATLLAVGLSWSHIWRRLSGQLEVDED